MAKRRTKKTRRHKSGKGMAAGNLVIALLCLLAAAVIVQHGCRKSRARYTAYDSIIDDAARRHNVPPALIRGVIRQESDFEFWRIGAKGEVGLMQLMGGAVADWERATGGKCRFRGKLFDPRLNIEIGTWYLSQGLEDYQGYREVEALALARYNGGPGRAAAWAPKDPRDTVLDRVDVASTRKYIANVLRYKEDFEKGSSPW